MYFSITFHCSIEEIIEEKERRIWQIIFCYRIDILWHRLILYQFQSGDCSFIQAKFKQIDNTLYFQQQLTQAKIKSNSLLTL